MKAPFVALLFVSLTAQAAPDAEKVVAALNQLAGDTSLKVLDGKVVLESFANNKKAGFEDCRNLALNSALLEISLAGESAQLEGKGSHRILLLAHADGDTVRGQVGVHVTTARGVEDRTYSYLMDDGTDKYCDLKANEGASAGMKKRKDVKKDYQKKYLPTLTQAELDSVKQKTKSTTLEQVAGEAVKKLLNKSECKEAVLNEALTKGAALFAAANKAPPITYFLFAGSKIETKDGNTTGQVRLAMTDASGDAKMITETTLAATETDDACTVKTLETVVAK